MTNNHFNTLSEAVDAWTQEGFHEDFDTIEGKIRSLNTKETYEPEALDIVASYRFEGKSNPDDSTALFVLEAKNGARGTMVTSYGAKANENDDLIRRLGNN